MLDFWYSERCTRHIKMLVCVITCLIIFISSSHAALPAIFVYLSLSIGIALHLLRLYALKPKQSVKIKQMSRIAFYLMPIVLWAVVSLVLPQQHLAMLMIQIIAFSALGLFIISIYSDRAKRFEHISR